MPNYTKTVWEDEVLAGAERFEITKNAGGAVDAIGDLAQCGIALKTSVVKAGTPLNAANLNKIEDALELLAGLIDVYDLLHFLVLETDEIIKAEDNLMLFPVPDKYNGKKAVRLFVYLPGAASSSGNVVVRVYNKTTSSVLGTVTLTAGNKIGSSVIDVLLTENDELRIDVTSAGTGAKGLQVQIKVDKS